jgi:hypothetical protein
MTREGNQGIYVDLDSLFDTRLTTLTLIDKDLSMEEIKGEFFIRTCDSFKHIPHKVFDYFYKHRTVNTLKLSQLTKIVKLVMEFANNVSLNDKELGGEGDVVLYVNTYPYDLNEQQEKIIKASLITYMPKITNVVTRFDYNVSPEWLDRYVSMIVMYDGYKWLTKNVANGKLKKNPLLDILFIVPKIIFVDGEHTEKDFEYLEKTMIMTTRLKMLEILNFCIPIKTIGKR